jgi:hypothetical protein
MTEWILIIFFYAGASDGGAAIMTLPNFSSEQECTAAQSRVNTLVFEPVNVRKANSVCVARKK